MFFYKKYLQFLLNPATIYIMGSNARLMNNLEMGRVYRRETLMPFTKAVDRDLKSLSRDGTLIKVAPGLYYYPKKSRFGELPPSDFELVNTFLKDDPFLLFSWNDYNSLQLGLSQLYNKMVVYNHKRHEEVLLGNKMFDFRRPHRGFPTELSKEFLLVDLLNNLFEFSDDPEEVKRHFKEKLASFDLDKLTLLSKLYGKIATKKFLKGVTD
jgi:hypothetical protein